MAGRVVVVIVVAPRRQRVVRLPFVPGIATLPACCGRPVLLVVVARAPWQQVKLVVGARRAGLGRLVPVGQPVVGRPSIGFGRLEALLGLRVPELLVETLILQP